MTAEQGTTRPRHTLVLGGSGFIGTTLVRHLRDAGHVVRVGDLVAPSDLSVPYFFCDVRKPESLTNAMRDVDLVFNLAAVHRDDESDSRNYYVTNVTGATNVCAAMVLAGVAHAVFVSSVAVYGHASLQRDERSACEPTNHYGKSKLLAEGEYLQWSDVGAGRFVEIVRPTAVFGNGNKGNIGALMRVAARMRLPTFGDGCNMKSIAYVENLAKYLVFTASCRPVGVARVSNYVDEPQLSLAELTAILNSAAGRSPRTLRVPAAAGWAVALAGTLAARLGVQSPATIDRFRKMSSSSSFTSCEGVRRSFEPTFSLPKALELSMIEYCNEVARP